MASAEEVHQLRELIALQGAQLDAVAHELTTHRATATQAAAQAEARSSLCLVDTRLLTKPNVYSGEHDGKERWSTWSFKMKAYCAAMSPRLGELMLSASRQDQDIRQDEMTPNDGAHSTNLYYILSLLTDGEALDIVQNSPTNNGMEVWRRMVSRWEPRVPSRFRGMLQAVLFPKWDIPGADVTQLLTAWEKQVQDYEQQSGDDISDAIKLGVVLHHLPDASLREHLLLNSQSYSTYTLMAAEIRTVVMARTTWSGPTPMDVSVLAKDAICHVCSKRGHFAKDCWYQSNKGGGKGKKGKKGKGKGNKHKDGDNKKKGTCHNCHEVGHFARDCPKKKEQNNPSSSGGGNMHCLTHTDEQLNWIMMLAEVGQTWEQSSNVEFLVDSGAACHAWPCKVKPGTSQGGTFLTATGAPVESQGRTEVTFQLLDVHGESITVKAVFELLPVRRPILSVSRLVDKGFAVVMGNDAGNKLRKNGREIHLHKSNGVYHLRASTVSDLSPLEDQETRNDAGPPAGAVSEATTPWTLRLPYKPTD